MHRRAVTGLLAATAIAFLAMTLAAIGAGIAFGYDESVYAQLTRHWLTGAPASGWDLHRPPGLSVLAVVPQAAGLTSEWAHRLIGAAAGIGVVLAASWLAGSAGGPLAAFVAAVALAAASPLQVESASFLSDVPSTLVLLVIAALAWRQVRRPGPIDRSVVWIGPLAAIAFYLRYGAVVELAALAAATAVVAGPRLVDGWRTVAATALVFGLALIPHVAIAVAETGTPWGILASASRAAGGGNGLPLVTYIAWFPWTLIGPLGAAVALAGIVGAIRHARSSSFARYAGIAALVSFAVLGTVIHAEPRYVLFPMTLLMALGSVEVAALVEGRRWPGRAALAAVAVAGLVLAAVTTATEIRTRADLFDWKREAGRDISAFAGPPRAPDCSIRTADVPILSWYSGCSATGFIGGEELVGSSRFVVLRADGHLQPPGSAADATRDAELWRTYDDGTGRPAAVVYLLAGEGR
jgi:hypothetical protein